MFSSLFGIGCRGAVKLCSGSGSEKKKFSDGQYPDSLPQDQSFPVTDPTVYRDAITKYLEYRDQAADNDRKNLEEWKALAIKIGERIPSHHRESSQQTKETVAEFIKQIFCTSGRLIVDLHQFFEPASVVLQHILTRIHDEMNDARRNLEKKIKEVEDEPADDQKKLEMLAIGIVIWDELIKLEENVAAMIRHCIQFQEGLETLSNDALKGLLFAIMLATMGDGDMKFLEKVDVHWDKEYRTYLLNAISPGQNRLELIEINVGRMMAKGFELASKEPAVLANNISSKFARPATPPPAAAQTQPASTPVPAP